MSCNNSDCYLPQPPRAWSRVQSRCSQVNDTNISVISEIASQYYFDDMIEVTANLNTEASTLKLRSESANQLLFLEVSKSGNLTYTQPSPCTAIDSTLAVRSTLSELMRQMASLGEIITDFQVCDGRRIYFSTTGGKIGCAEIMDDRLLSQIDPKPSEFALNEEFPTHSSGNKSDYFNNALEDFRMSMLYS